MIGKIRKATFQFAEFFHQIESMQIPTAMKQTNRALVALVQGIAQDAIKRSQTGTCADQQQGLLWLAGHIDAIASRAAYLGLLPYA